MATDILRQKLIVETTQGHKSVERLHNAVEKIGNIKVNPKVNLPLGKITGDVEKFGESLAASNARVLAFGATTGVIVSLQQAFKGLFVNIVEVQKELANINVILQANQTNFDKFSKQLFKISNDTGSAFSVAAQAAAEFARQGLSLQNTLESTSAAMILVRISGIDATKAVEALTAATNTFNASNLKTIDIVNKLANVDAAFATSANGLSEGLRRVGSVAVDAGVDIDQLISLIASLQQTTARGEAVIGNGLKTIFTRLGRTSVLNQLEELGLNVRNAAGETRGAIPILKELAGTYESLSSAQQAQISESVAGVFQINTFKAAIKDLGKETSIYNRALDISRNSSDEAEQRNAKLNETLASLLNSLSNNLAKVSSSIGEAGIEEPFRNLLKVVNSSVEGFDRLLDSTTAVGSVVQGIFKGIGTFIQGPGLIAIAQGLSKLFVNVTSSVGSALSLFLNLNKEKRIFNKLLQEGSIRIENEKGQQLSVLNIQKQINTVLAQRIAQETKLAALARSVTPGVRVSGADSKRILGLADGFFPIDAIMKEKEAISKGVGGASPSAKPVFERLNLGSGKQDVVVNTDEKIVRNIGGTGLDAVLTKDMQKKLPSLASGNLKIGGDINEFNLVGILEQQARNAIGKTSLSDVFEKAVQDELNSFKKKGSSQRDSSLQRQKELARKAQERRRELSVQSFNEKRDKSLDTQKQLSEQASARRKAIQQEKELVKASQLAAKKAERRLKLEKQISQTKEAQVKRAHQAFKIEETSRKSRSREGLNFLTDNPQDDSNRRFSDRLRGRIKTPNFSKNQLIGGSFALPFVGEAANSYLQKTGAISSGTGDVVSSGLRGVSSTILAGSQFGPAGAAIAGAVSAMSFLETISNNVGDSFKELSRESEDLASRNTDISNSATSFIQASQTLIDLTKSGGSALDIQKSAFKKFEAIQSILSSSPDVAQKLINAKPEGGRSLSDVQGDILFDFEKNAKQEQRLLDTRAQIRKISDQESSFGSRFSEALSAGDSAIQKSARENPNSGFLKTAISSIGAGVSGTAGRFLQGRNNIKLDSSQRDEITNQIVKAFDPTSLTGSNNDIRRRISNLGSSGVIGSSLSIQSLIPNIDEKTQTDLNQIGDKKLASDISKQLLVQFESFNSLRESEQSSKSAASLTNSIKKLADNISFNNSLRSNVSDAAFDVEQNRVKNLAKTRPLTDEAASRTKEQLDLENIERSRINKLNSINEKLLNQFKSDILPSASNSEDQKKLVSLLRKFESDGDGLSLSKNALEALGKTGEDGSLDSLTFKKLDQLEKGLVSELAAIKTSNEKALLIHRQNSEANKRQLEITRGLSLLGGVDKFSRPEFGETSFNTGFEFSSGIGRISDRVSLTNKRNIFGGNSSEFLGARSAIDSSNLQGSFQNLSRIERLKELDILPKSPGSRRSLRDQAFRSSQEIQTQKAQSGFSGEFTGLISNLIKEIGNKAPELRGQINRVVGRDDFQTAIGDSDFGTIRDIIGANNFQARSSGLQNKDQIAAIFTEIEETISRYEDVKSNINNSARANAENLVPFNSGISSRGSLINSQSSGRVNSLSDLQKSLNVNALTESNRNNLKSIFSGVSSTLAANKPLLEERGALNARKGELLGRVQSGKIKNIDSVIPELNKLSDNISKLNAEIKANTDKNNSAIQNASGILGQDLASLGGGNVNNINEFLSKTVDSFSDVDKSFAESAKQVSESSKSMEGNIGSLNSSMEKFADSVKNLEQVVTVNASTQLSLDGSSLSQAIETSVKGILEGAVNKAIVEKIKEAFMETLGEKVKFLPKPG